MGSGKGSVDLCLIMRILALIFCVCAVGLNVSGSIPGGAEDFAHVSNAVIYGVCGYIIILLLFLIWSIAKGEIYNPLTAIILLIGFIWNVAAGVGCMVVINDNSYGTKWSTFQLAGAGLGAGAGIVMLVDSLHNFGLF